MKEIDYDDYVEKSVEELLVTQDILQLKYDLDSYADWFYDQATGILTFSTSEEELNFRYCEVGTYSTKTNTWKWSWDNEHTLEKVKGMTIQIKEFGIASNFTKLTLGCFESSEEEAWEFTAISNKILNGIGAYRPISDHLLVFMVLLETIDNETAQKIKNKYVECNRHETGRLAFICKHLLTRNKVGFEEAFDTTENMELEDEDDFQAWCDECEKVRNHEGEWNDISMKFADIKLVCEKCYFEIKEINLGYK